MNEREIETLRALILNTQGGDDALVWRDVDGGIHEVVGFNPNFKEHPEDHLSEPAFILLRGGCIAAYNTEFDRFYILSPAPQPNVVLTNEQKEMTLLRIVEAMGGETDSSESRHSWLNWFCSDEIHNVQDDTFNRCNEKGWLSTSHNTDWDTSTTTLTKTGLAALAATEDQP